MPDAPSGWPARIVFATGNRGKLREVAEILAPAGVTVVGVADVATGWHVVEDGDTFAANARLKAESLADRTGLPALGDDSGLEVDALGGRPGVRSARYGGPGLDDAGRCARLLAALQGVPQRSARFRCVLVLAQGDAWVSAEGTLEGEIADAPCGRGGFGYDPVFVLRDRGVTLAEIAADEKNALSHRAAAMRALLARIRSGEVCTPAFIDSLEGES